MQCSDAMSKCRWKCCEKTFILEKTFFHSRFIIWDDTLKMWNVSRGWVDGRRNDDIDDDGRRNDDLVCWAEVSAEDTQSGSEESESEASVDLLESSCVGKQVVPISLVDFGIGQEHEQEQDVMDLMGDVDDDGRRNDNLLCWTDASAENVVHINRMVHTDENDCKKLTQGGSEASESEASVEKS